MTSKHKTVRLQIQGDQLMLSAPTDAGLVPLVSSAVSGIRDVLDRDPMNEPRLEDAIARTEDLIMPAIERLPRGDELEVTGSELGKVFHLLPQGDSSVATIESVECLFNQLADHASGAPIAWRHSLPTGEVALGLTVIRELMHHGGFRTVALTEDET